MNQTRDAVEELIEESYLLSLSGEEIRRDLNRFAEVCGWVIVENIKDKRKLDMLTRKLAMVRVSSLISSKAANLNILGIFKSDGTVRSPTERWAKTIARNKRLILKTIEQCEPQLIPIIEGELKANSSKGSFPSMRYRLNRKFYNVALKVGLVLIGLVALALIYLLVLIK